MRPTRYSLSETYNVQPVCLRPTTYVLRLTTYSLSESYNLQPVRLRPTTYRRQSLWDLQRTDSPSETYKVQLRTNHGEAGIVTQRTELQQPQNMQKRLPSRDNTRKSAEKLSTREFFNREVKMNTVRSRDVSPDFCYRLLIFSLRPNTSRSD